jgi:glycosyltransferase involved in cell wall biosynthesis
LAVHVLGGSIAEGRRANTGRRQRTGARLRVAFLTDIVTPYLAAVLEWLSVYTDLTVLFCSRTGTRGMDWTVDLTFRHEVIEGLTIRRRHLDATDYYLSPRILAALQRARPQAVVSGGFSVPTLYAMIYGRARGVPVIIQSDGTSGSESRLGPEQRIARQVLRRFASGAVANSEAAARRFVEIGFPAARIFRAPHTIRIEPYWSIAEQRPKARDGPLRLLFVGRFIPRKGCHWLLPAVAQARGAGADTRLIMAGVGPEEARLRSLAGGLGLPVTWRGFVDQPDLPRLYAEADAFAFPTMDDPFGVVLIEAAAAGLPLIASPFGGATEDLVRDGVNGFIVDPSQTTAMAEAIARLAREPTLRTRMGRRSYELTLGRTPEASAVGYVEAVQAALALAGRR